jgi:hypothetical protein
MQALVILLLGTLILGGTRVGRQLRERPLVLLAMCTVAAASFYSMRVIL